MALPLMAQTNSSVSVFVQVPSFTIEFPSKMSPNEINKALKKLFGEKMNLTYTFRATNSQTHEQVSFMGNSMLNTNELEELFALQKQQPASKIAAPSEGETNQFSTQSATLSAFRKKFSQFANIPDSQAVLMLGKAFPIYLQNDRKFAEEFAQYSATEKQNPISAANNNIEERKVTALERQADALERQANATENQAFQQEVLKDDIDFQMGMMSLQNELLQPIQQPNHTRYITIPGQIFPIIVSP